MTTSTSSSQAKALAGLALALLWSALAVFCWRTQIEITRSEQATAALQAKISTELQPELTTQTTTTPNDFVQSLPDAPATVETIKEIQRSCRANGVGLIGFKATPSAVTTEQVSKTTLALDFQGSYINIKQVLRDVSARTPTGVLTNLRLHRLTSATDLQGQVEWILLSRPNSQ